MKRVLLLAVVVGLFAGQASAAMYTMDRDTAALLTVQGVTGTHILFYVGYNPGLAAADYIAGPNADYGADNMLYAVGFTGNLQAPVGGTLASVKWGLGRAEGLTGTYDGFFLPISNDNQQIWEYKLYVDAAGGPYISPSWTSLTGGADTTLILPFGGDVDFSTVTDIGFIVQFNKATTGGGTNRNDDYHTSVVPVPAAVLLGFLGLGAAGLKLRRFA